MISTILFVMALIAALYLVVTEINNYRKSSTMRLRFYTGIGMSLIIIGTIILDNMVLAGKVLIYSGACIAVLIPLFLLMKSNMKRAGIKK